MNKTLQEKVETGFTVSQKMIADMEAKLQEAIRRENWSRAAELKSCIDRMQQILVVFEQIAERN